MEDKGNEMLHLAWKIASGLNESIGIRYKALFQADQVDEEHTLISYFYDKGKTLSEKQYLRMITEDTTIGDLLKTAESIRETLAAL